MQFYFKQLISFSQKLYHIDSEENLLEQIENFIEKTNQTIKDLAPYFQKKFELRNCSFEDWQLRSELENIPVEQEAVNPIEEIPVTELNKGKYLDAKQWLEDCSMALRNKTQVTDLVEVKQRLEVPQVLNYYQKCLKLRTREDELKSSVGALETKKKMLLQELNGLQDKKRTEWKIFGLQCREKTKEYKQKQYERYKQKLSNTMSALEVAHNQFMDKLNQQYIKNKLKYEAFQKKKQEHHEKFIKKLKNDILFYRKMHDRCFKTYAIWDIVKTWTSKTRPDKNVFKKTKKTKYSWFYSSEKKEYKVEELRKCYKKKVDEKQANMWATKLLKAQELLSRVDRSIPQKKE
jgi:hypothetical protein